MEEKAIVVAAFSESTEVFAGLSRVSVVSSHGLGGNADFGSVIMVQFHRYRTL